MRIRGIDRTQVCESNAIALYHFGFWILDFGFWILKALPIGSFRNSNVSSLSPNGITKSSSGALALSEAIALAQRNQV
jgi:hypothetical protein